MVVFANTCLQTVEQAHWCHGEAVHSRQYLRVFGVDGPIESKVAAGDNMYVLKVLFPTQCKKDCLG